MKERQPIYVTKHNKYEIHTTRIARDRPKRYECMCRDAGVQYDYPRDLVCTCRISCLRKPQEVRYFSDQPRRLYFGSRSYTDIGVGSVKVLQKKKVRRIYLPETDDRGVGSSDLSSFFSRKPRPNKGNYPYDTKNISTQGGGKVDETITVLHEKLSPIYNQKNTKSESTSPKLSIEQNQRKNVDIGSNTQEKTLVSISTQIDEAQKTDDIKIEVRTVEVSVEHDKRPENYKKSSLKMTARVEEKEKRISKRAQEAERVYSSDSLVEHVHNLENPSEDKQSHADVMENKLEREYRRMFSTKSKESKEQKTDEERNGSSMKSTSLLRRRFEALRRGLAKKEDSKRSAVVADKESSNVSELSKRDVSIASDPPSLESRSYTDVKVNIAEPNIASNSKAEYRKPPAIKKPSNRSEEEDGSYQRAEGMFNLWGKIFNLDDEESPESSKVKDQNESGSKKDGKRFFFFKKRSNKEPKQFFKKGVTTGRCEVGDGLMIKIGAAHTKARPAKEKERRTIDRIPTMDQIPEQYEEMFKKAWLQKFLAQTIESRNSVKIRWNNNAYATSSSTIFEIMENVYKDTGIIFRSKSEINTGDTPYYKSSAKQRVNFVQDIQAWMVPKFVPDKTIKPPIINSNNKEGEKNKIQVRISDHKWIIDKSKAFAHKIEVVLHSRNIVTHRNSSAEYLTIDIPKGFFSDSGTDSGGQEQTSNEEVYKIVEYELPEINTRQNTANFEIGDHLKDIKVTVSLKDSRNFESKIVETVIKRSPKQRDIMTQGSHVYIPKRCNVIGVGIITQDVNRGRRPILKIQDEYSDDELDHSMCTRQVKSKFAESYLQDYYRHWTPLGVDFFSCCISDSQIQCCSEDSLETVNNQGDGTKSCPNIYENYVTSTVISSCGTSCCSPCGPIPLCYPWNEEEKPGIVSKFYNKIKLLKPEPYQEEKRVLPKDSLEVFKRRKLYAMSAKSKWRCPDDTPYSVPSKESKCAQDTMIECPKVMKSCWKPTPRAPKSKVCNKHVSLPDCDALNTSLFKQLETINPSGILTFKGAAKCEMCEKKGSVCSKHATVDPSPVCEIPPPHRPCLDEPAPRIKCRPPPPCGVIMPARDISKTSQISVSLKIRGRDSAKSCHSAPGLPSPKQCGPPPQACPKPPQPPRHCPPPGPPKSCYTPPVPCPPQPCPHKTETSAPPAPPVCYPRPCNPYPTPLIPIAQHCPPKPCCPPPTCPHHPPPKTCHYPPPPTCPQPEPSMPCHPPPPCPPKHPKNCYDPPETPPEPCPQPKPPMPCHPPPPCPPKYPKHCYDPPETPPEPCPQPKPPMPCHPPPPCPPKHPKNCYDPPETPPEPCPQPKPPMPCHPPPPCTQPKPPMPCHPKPCPQPMPCHPPPEPCETPPEPCGTPPEPCETPPEPCETPPEPCETPPEPCETPPEPCETPPEPCETPPEPCETPPKPCHPPPKPCKPPSKPCPPKKPKPCNPPTVHLEKPPCPHSRPHISCEKPPKPCSHPKPKPCDGPSEPCETPPKPCPHPKPKPCDAPSEPCETPPKPCPKPVSKPCDEPVKPCKKPKKQKCKVPGKPPCGSPVVSGIHLYSPPRSTCSSPSRSSDCEKPKKPCADPPPPCDESPSSSASSCSHSSLHKKGSVCSDSPNSCTHEPPCKKKPPKCPPPTCKSPSTESCKIKDGAKEKIKKFLDLPFTPECESPKPKCPHKKPSCPSEKPKCPSKKKDCSSPKKPACKGCKKTCSKEFPWPLKNQNSNQCSVQSLTLESGNSIDFSAQTCTVDDVLNDECRRKQVQCPSKTSCRSPPRVSGIFLKKKPGRNCPNDCSQLGDVTATRAAVKRVDDSIIINIKKTTDSTDDIRDGLNIKVQDFDGNTLYERRDYTNDAEVTNNTHKQKRHSVLNEMYKNSNVHVVSTTKLVRNMECDDESNAELGDAKSEASVANLIEINFKLKVTQGDKNIEYNIGADDGLDRTKNKTKNQIGQTSQEVFRLKDEAEQCTDENNDKNDINIKIIIKNYKPKNKNKLICDEFAQGITEKFQTVSTGYSVEGSDVDNIYSVHRTVNQASSAECSKTDIESQPAGCEKCYEEIPNSNNIPEIVTVEQSESNVDIRKTENIFKTDEQEVNGIQNYVYTEKSTYGEKRSYSSVTDIDEQDVVKENGKSNITGNCNAAPKSLTRDEKKSILKKVLEKVRKSNKKEKMKQFTDVLNLILTDSSDYEGPSKEQNELVNEMTYASLKPDHFKGTDSMNNYYKADSSVSSQQTSDANTNVKYPTQNVSESSVRDSDEYFDDEDKPGTCLCSTFAARLNMCSISGGGCCCRAPTKIDEETFCDLRTEEDFLLLNYKTIEYIDVETQNSKYFCNGNKVSVHSRAVSSTFRNNDEKVLEVLKKENSKQETKDFAMSVHHRLPCQYKKFCRNTMLRISDEDKVYLLNTKPTNVAVATEFTREPRRDDGENEKRRKKMIAKYERVADILQSYETKKAVLEIYAERTMSDESGHLVARLPKFVYEKESDIERNYGKYVETMYRSMKNSNVY